MFGLGNYSLLKTTAFGWIFIPLMIWDLVWKGIALWKAGRNNQKYWFIALLLVNSIGILPLIYLAFFQKKSKNK